MASREEIIIETIKKNPGIRFTEVMENVGLKNGVLSHYIRKLENSGSIHVDRSPRVARFYGSDLNQEEQKLVTKLRQETPKRILIALLNHNELSFKQITATIKKSPATVSFYLSTLVQDEIVFIRRSDKKSYYFIAKPERILVLIDEYHPDIVQKTSENFADIVSSL